MNRRDLLKKAGLTVAIGATVLKVVPSIAQSTSTSALVGQIGANHGHAVKAITGEELMSLARDLGDNETTELDIQGDSNHAHSISLSKEDIGALLIGEEVELNSSTDSRHSHTVIIVLEKN